MSFFKNLFGRKETTENNKFSILQNDEQETVTQKRKLTNDETQTSTSPRNLSKETKKLENSRVSSDTSEREVFDKHEVFHLTALYIVDHRWEEIGSSRDEAVDYLYPYLSEFITQKDDLEEDIVGFFNVLQNMIMAKKPVKDFYELQNFPAFSTQALRVFLELLRFSKNNEKQAFKHKFDEIYPANEQYIRPDEPIMVVEENSGLSPEEAIIIRVVGPNSGVKRLPRARIGVHTEYCYLCFNYGNREADWHFRGQMLLVPIADKEYDCLNISVAGKERKFYFDITDFRGDYNYIRQ